MSNARPKPGAAQGSTSRSPITRRVSHRSDIPGGHAVGASIVNAFRARHAALRVLPVRHRRRPDRLRRGRPGRVGRHYLRRLCGPAVTGYGSRLFDQHAAKLASSGVSPEVADERGYRTADTKSTLGSMGFGQAQRRPPALVIPLHGTNGDGVVGFQCRPDEPRFVKGKAVKYETVVGQEMVVDCPPRCRESLRDPAIPLWIAEGPLKADAAAGIGLCCVALLGVWNWRNGNGWLPDWEHVALRGRQVLVVFDSDAVLKESVHQAMGRLGAVLAGKGAAVLYVYQPSDGGAKVGLDDYLVAGHGVDDLLALASPKLRRLAGGEGVGESQAEPADDFSDVPDESGAQLAAALAVLLRRHVAFASRHHPIAIALWVMHTWCVRAFDSTPRLALLSPMKQCGKTRVLEIIELTACRAEMTISMSPAYMFRSVESWCPTLLVDEVDAIFGPHAKEHEDLRALLNSGHHQGATGGRKVREGTATVPARYSTFCPVALAGIGRALPDTITDRSIPIRMRRRAKGEGATVPTAGRDGGHHTATTPPPGVGRPQHRPSRRDGAGVPRRHRGPPRGRVVGAAGRRRGDRRQMAQAGR